MYPRFLNELIYIFFYIFFHLFYLITLDRGYTVCGLLNVHDDAWAAAEPEFQASARSMR
jgi:hypothetical protein